MNPGDRMQCPYLKKCGACSYIGEPYEDTLRKKEEQVRRFLKPYVIPDGIVGMDDPYHYRNKVHRVCTYEKAGRREFHKAGIYAEGTHKVIPVDSCLIEDERADAIIRDLLLLAREFKIRHYNEDTGTGLLRHILIRTAHATGEILVVLVLSNPELPGKKHFIRKLTEKHPEITSVVINVNARPTNMILGERERAAYGPGFIEDILCGKKFRISPRSFYQVNPVQTEKLYAKAIELAGLTGKERVIDAYCGIGTIGLIASDKAKEVVSVELNPDAVKDAIVNAKRNGIKNVRFYRNDASVFMRQMANEGESVDVVFMDPPRSGSDEKFLSSVVTLRPKRIVYVSCEPTTLARDLKYLTKHGYRAVTAVPFDMFPATEHCETVCLLSRKDK